MWTLLSLAGSILGSVAALFRCREEQAIVELALRQQFAAYAQERPRPRLSPLDLEFWVVLSRLWPLWKNQPRHGLALCVEDSTQSESAAMMDGIPPQPQGRHRRDGFSVVPMVRFRLLYVRFAIDDGRRRILHFNVTENPTARWMIQQLRKTFPDEPAHRFMLYDNDAIFSLPVTGVIKSFEIDPKRTAFRSPWQNGTAERVVGSVGQDLLDHVGVLNEDH